MLKHIRRRWGWKLFLSYLIVILVGILVLASAAELAVPSAFDRHLAAMNEMMRSRGMGMGGPALESDLYSNFQSAVNEALALATLAAFLAALVVSWTVSRQVVAPVREMMTASGRIAEGHYEERVRVPGDLARDEIDELGRLALRFNQMAAKLERIETMRRQLIGDVAHELRTPLTTIQGSLEGLIDGVLPAEETTFQQIHRETDRLQRLVNDLQELSRVEGGALAMQVRRVSVPRLVDATRERLGFQFDEKGVLLACDVPHDLPLVWADEDRVLQVLLNLVGNALQYTPAGGTVRIAARTQQGEMQLAVRDTGIGISQEHLPHVFTRFYRVDKSRSRAGGGSGIGLTIARHLVEANGGRIWVESPGLNQGSTFTFTLPLAP